MKVQRRLADWAFDPGPNVKCPVMPDRGQEGVTS